MRPSVGRIVHYVSYGEVYDDTEAVGLAVLNPEGMFFNRTVPYNGGDNGPAGGTWHWPERVDG